MLIRDPVLERLTAEQCEAFNNGAPEENRIRIANEIRRVQEERRRASECR